MICEESNTQNQINFTRLKMYAKSLLKYTHKESKFLLFYKLIAEFEEYCLFNNIKLEKTEYSDENIIPDAI